MRARHFASLHRFIAARFSPGQELGLHLTVGLAMMVLAAWLFGALAEAVMGGRQLGALDSALAQWLHAHTRPALTAFLLPFTHLHSLPGMTLLAVLLGWYFQLRRAPYWLLTLVVAVPGGMLLNVLLKYVYMRARPSFPDPMLMLDTYSFPSGHTAAATLFYGILAAYVVCLNRRWLWRCAAVAGAALMVLLVGISRMYLGVHYLSDVLAAVVESCGWLAVCITASSTLRRRRAARPQQ